VVARLDGAAPTVGDVGHSEIGLKGLAAIAQVLLDAIAVVEEATQLHAVGQRWHSASVVGMKV